MESETATIESLRDRIYSSLMKEIDEKKCCLLDLPNYYNPGDQLIWLGDEHIVNRLSKNIVYRSSLHFFNPKKVPLESVILLQSGGGFGDLYYKHQKFREYIVQKFPKNRIVILPSTVYFSNFKNLQKSKRLFSQHQDLVICARDNASLRVLTENFQNSRNYLVPDTAFAINGLTKKNEGWLSSKKRVLFLYRQDKEKGSVGKDSLKFINNLDVLDWPTQKKSRLVLHMIFLLINRTLLRLFKLLGSHWNERFDVYGLINYHSRELQIDTAVKLLSNYNLIITTRLHGHILACLLGIPNILLDNSYGKNRSFYETWMRSNSMDAYFAASVNDIKKIYESFNLSHE